MDGTDCVLGLIITLDRFGLIKKGYSLNRIGKPLSCAEDLMWDYTATSFHVGEVLEGIDANRHTSKVHRTGKEKAGI
jgi:hypothetical protein